MYTKANEIILGEIRIELEPTIELSTKLVIEEELEAFILNEYRGIAREILTNLEAGKDKLYNIRTLEKSDYIVFEEPLNVYEPMDEVTVSTVNKKNTKERGLLSNVELGNEDSFYDILDIDNKDYIIMEELTGNHRQIYIVISSRGNKGRNNTLESVLIDNCDNGSGMLIAYNKEYVVKAFIEHLRERNLNELSEMIITSN